MKKVHNINALWIALLIFLLDQLSKDMMRYFIRLGGSVPIIRNVVHLTLVFNTGAGFGILKGNRIFFIIFSVIILILLIYKWKKIPSNINVSFPLGLIMGGLVGNLFDRVFLGYVIDFIDFRIWPVFNAADSAITIGVIWLVIYLWKEK